MRPIKLTMSAFGPYAEKEILELDRLGENGIYLITGQTGAGKTSIFDAICYALYDTSSGDLRDDTMLRSKYALDSTDTFVELEFSCNDKVYRVRRNPEYLRPKTRGDGFTTQIARAELVMPDGRIIDKSKREVTKAVEEIIGLDREQFLKISMIAQGEFRKLLMASTEDKKKIFRKIFKTAKYETISLKIKEEANALYGQYKDTLTTLNAYYQGVLVGEESALKEELSIAIKEGELPERILSIIENITQEDLTTKSRLIAETGELEKQISELTMLINRAVEYDKKLILLENKKQEQKNLCDNENSIKEALDKLLDEKLGIENLKEELTLIKKDLFEYDKIGELLRQIKEAESNILFFAGRIESEQAKIANSEEELAKLKEQEKGLEGAEEKTEKLYLIKKDLETKKESALTLGSDYKNLLGFRLELKEKQGELKKRIENLNRLSKEYEEKNVAFLNGQAGIMASLLKEGEPCPVCGATHHIKKAKIGDLVPTDAELKQAKAGYENAKRLAEDLSSTCAKIIGQISGIENNLLSRLNENGITDDDSALDKIRQIFQCFKAEIDKINREIFEQEEKKKLKEQIKNQIPNIEKLIHDKGEEITLLKSKMATASAYKGEKEDQLKDKQKTLRFAERIDAERAIKEKALKIEEYERTLFEKTKEHQETINKISLLSGEIEGLKVAVSVPYSINLQEERANLLRLECERGKLLEKKEDVSLRLSSNELMQNKIKETARNSKSIEEKYQWLNALSQTANGTISKKDKISFETYIQMSYFERVLRRANIRLQKMTGGQYDLVRRLDSLNQRSQVGLDIDVLDHYNGSVRPVNSLSGGETFKASLSLALGLSDEIQSLAGGVKLDTMFIDEGFGSLDSESLSLAVGTLLELTEGNKLVGIISHVEELKGRIDKQILVEKASGERKGSKAKLII